MLLLVGYCQTLLVRMSEDRKTQMEMVKKEEKTEKEGFQAQISRKDFNTWDTRGKLITNPAQAL